MSAAVAASAPPDCSKTMLEIRRFSMGWPGTLEELVERADQAMHREKMDRR